MALGFHNYALAIMLLAMIPFEGTYGSHHNYQHQHLKSLHFPLFQHETMNKTGFIIVNGLQGGPGVTDTTSPFGTFYVCRSQPTDPPKWLELLKGLPSPLSFDGLQSILLAKLTLLLKHHKGSVSVVGSAHNTKHSDLPVVGGTEDFLFVQGYVTSSPVDIQGPTIFVYKIEFHLYWPPYATQAS